MHSENLKCWVFGWLPLWGFTGLILYASVLPPDQVPEALSRLSDKVLHVVPYFLLFWVGANAFEGSRFQLIHRFSHPTAFAYCLFIGWVSEWLQAFVPGRMALLEDWIANVVGAVLGWGVLAILRRKRRLRQCGNL